MPASNGPYDVGTLYHDGGGSSLVVCDAAGKEIAHVLPGDHEKDNANILAAAWAMFEVLDTLENDNGAIPAWLWTMKEEAVRQAKGEA